MDVRCIRLFMICEMSQCECSNVFRIWFVWVAIYINILSTPNGATCRGTQATPFMIESTPNGFENLQNQRFQFGFDSWDSPISSAIVGIEAGGVFLARFVAFCSDDEIVSTSSDADLFDASAAFNAKTFNASMTLDLSKVPFGNSLYKNCFWPSTRMAAVKVLWLPVIGVSAEWGAPTDTHRVRGGEPHGVSSK